MVKRFRSYPEGVGQIGADDWWQRMAANVKARGNVTFLEDADTVYTIAPGDYLIIGSQDGSSTHSLVRINLPPVEDVKGQIFIVITGYNLSATGEFAVYPDGTDLIDVDNSRVILRDSGSSPAEPACAFYSTGEEWLIVGFGTNTYA